jgi:superfamily II DNA or RNA helicase
MVGSAVELRPYQAEAIEAIKTALAGGERPTGQGPVNRPAIVLATGLGKTVIFSALTAQHLAEQRSRVLVLVHRDELAQQARAKIHSANPGIRVGIVKGQMNDCEADVVVASVPTIGRAEGIGRRERWRDIRNVGLIIADECHHAAAETWRRTLTRFGGFEGVPTIGFTATMSREDNRGLGEVWQEVVFSRDTLWGIRNRYLADVRGQLIRVPKLDLTDVHVRGGDLQQEEVAEAMLRSDTGQIIAKGVQEHASDRPGVVFAPNVATADQFTSDLNDVGIRSETILGTTARSDRGSTYERFRTGVTQYLVNAMVLTEGWDAPWASCAVVARPTKSSALYQQMIGRVLRPWPAGGKRDALVLDVVGATTKHHLSTLIDLGPDKPKKPNQSILEMWDEDELYGDDDAYDIGTTNPPGSVSRIISTEVDLLAESTSVWLQTKAGTWFIPAGDQLFFLWPEHVTAEVQTYTVGVTPSGYAAQAYPIVDGCTFELAMSWAEKYATEHDPTVSGKSAKWRRRGLSSQAQARQAMNLGLVIPAGSMSTGDAADQIMVAMASQRLDG